MTVLAGGKHLVVNGEQWPIGDAYSYSVQTEKAESLTGSVRVGRVVNGAPAFIECDIYVDEGRSTTGLVAARNADVSLVLQDRTVTLSADADYVGEGDVDGTKMMLKARFEAKTGREVF